MDYARHPDPNHNVNRIPYCKCITFASAWTMFMFFNVTRAYLPGNYCGPCMICRGVESESRVPESGFSSKLYL